MSARPTVIIGHDLPPDMAEAIREMGVEIERNDNRKPRTAGKVIVVVSPKGGSGKTAIASNLSVALSQRHPGEVVDHAERCLGDSVPDVVRPSRQGPVQAGDQLIEALVAG